MMNVPTGIIEALIAFATAFLIFLLTIMVGLQTWMLLEIVRMKTSLALLCQKFTSLPCHPQNGFGKCKKNEPR
jgi:hypothetical protein